MKRKQGFVVSTKSLSVDAHRLYTRFGKRRSFVDDSSFLESRLNFLRLFDQRSTQKILICRPTRYISVDVFMFSQKSSRNKHRQFILVGPHVFIKNSFRSAMFSFNPPTSLVTAAYFRFVFWGKGRWWERHSHAMRNIIKKTQNVRRKAVLLALF